MTVAKLSYDFSRMAIASVASGLLSQRPRSKKDGLEVENSKTSSPHLAMPSDRTSLWHGTAYTGYRPSLARLRCAKRSLLTAVGKQTVVPLL